MMVVVCEKIHLVMRNCVNITTTLSFLNHLQGKKNFDLFMQVIYSKLRVSVFKIQSNNVHVTEFKKLNDKNISHILP